MRERSLLAFTLLVQLAVGAFLGLGPFTAWPGDPAVEPSVRSFTDAALLGTGMAMGLALLASVFHLGAPSGAWRAVVNLRTSWLSREVLLALLFTLLVGLLAAVRGSGSPVKTAGALVWFAGAACGIGVVYAMGRVYRLRTVPRWDTAWTTASFFVTTLLLGSLAVASGLALWPDLPDAMVRRPFLALALVGTGCFAAELARPGSGRLRALRRALLLAGAAACLAALAVPGRGAWLIAMAFAGALAAQGIGRYQFYVEGPRRPL